MAYRFKHGDRPLDDYTIQRAVGSGGFGEVYYAISDGGREVALKFLRDNPHVELRGVSHCINLKSPHLVSIFDVKKNSDGDYFIIMEYCSGPSLRDVLIAEPNGLGAQKAAFFVREIAKGLAYLHDRGIVHRDLKPGNIFYDDGYVKIGDYGLSKFIAVSRHSAQTASVGTVHYMAPEIGTGNYSRGVDIYALGVMLYEMLLGKVPFEGSSMGEVLMKHLTAQPEVENLPHPFGPVIRKALQKDPNDRYQSVDEMIEALLEVEEVKQSLAGFSPRSLEGAVHHGTPDRARSPMPSPNPPGYERDFAQPAGGGRQPPFAQPVGPVGEVPARVAKRIDRISRKIDAKMEKMAKRHGVAARPKPTPAGAAAVPASADRRKRVLLSGLLSIGLAVGLGILIGNAFRDEHGAAAGMLVIAMSGGIALSRGAIRWFGAAYGPAWSQHMITACCCAPLMAIATAPIFDSSDSDAGVAIWLGLLVLAVFGCWQKEPDDDSEGEMRFGAAIWKAIAAAIWTMIAGAVIVNHDPDDFMFISAGVAGCVSLILQATAWWLPARAERAVQLLGTGLHAERAGPAPAVPPPVPPDAAMPGGHAGDQAHAAEPWDVTDEQSLGAHLASHTGSRRAPAGEPNVRLRWGITRAFWGLITFALMAGAIITFLIMLIVQDMPHGDKTGVLIGCTACAAFMLFALRKTTPVKRDGFWRETVRPFLQSAFLFGIGGTISGMSREWCCTPGEGRVALIAGLVLCSLLLLGITFFTGRRRRPPKPFVLDGEMDVGSPTPDAPGMANLAHEEMSKEQPATGGQVETPVRGIGEAAKGSMPRRGVTVLILGILAATVLMALAILVLAGVLN